MPDHTFYVMHFLGFFTSLSFTWVMGYCGGCMTRLCTTLIGLNYRPCEGDEIAMITTAPTPVTEITQNHKGISHA